MSAQSSGSPLSVSTYTDGIGAGTSNALLLVARLLIASLFFLTAWGGSPNAGYLKSLGVPNPELLSWIAIVVEYIVVLSLVLGVATRYGVLLGILYVIIATALAHRYWEFPQPQQLAQYTNFTKNLAIAGGLLLLLVSGSGRFAVDHLMSKKR